MVRRYARSAFKHGFNEEEIDCAIDNAYVIRNVRRNPVKILFLGPNLIGQILEVIVVPVDLNEVVIHADLMTRQFRNYLPKGTR